MSARKMDFLVRIFAGNYTGFQTLPQSNFRSKPAATIQTPDRAWQPDRVSSIRNRKFTIGNSYVPSSHEARYFSCSGVSTSMSMFIAANFKRATSLSISSGTVYTLGVSDAAFFAMYCADNA